MNKNELIELFKSTRLNMPADGWQIRRIQSYVENQYNRNNWVLDCIDGRFMIQKNNNGCFIIHYPSVNDIADKLNVENGYSYNLTDMEYRELKTLYFGKFRLNNPFLKDLINDDNDLIE